MYTIKCINLKNVSTLTSITILNTPISNLNYKINVLHFI
jgi:hypothetical protein